MDKKKLGKEVIKANCVLELERKIVGMKFLFTKEDFEEADARAVVRKVQYCVMVKSATCGHSIKVAGNNFACNASARALGIIKPDNEYKSGKSYVDFGFYKDIVISQNAINNINLCKHEAYGVMLKPLEEFDVEPDIVIIITNPYNAMRIVQGYSYTYGINPYYKMSGNQAICAECTSYPFQSNAINVSLLCAGTRYGAAWKDYEIGIGMPFNKFSTIIDGVYATVNDIETDEKKFMIKEKLEENGLTDLEVKFGTGYFLL